MFLYLTKFYGLVIFLMSIISYFFHTQYIFLLSKDGR